MIDVADNRNRLPKWVDQLLVPLITLALWLLTIVLGIIDIFVTWEGIAILTSRVTRPLIIWKDPLIFALAIILGVFAINSGRFHIIHFRQPRAWRFFVTTIGLELCLIGMIILLYFFAAD